MCEFEKENQVLERENWKRDKIHLEKTVKVKGETKSKIHSEVTKKKKIKKDRKEWTIDCRVSLLLSLSLFMLT